MSHCKTTIAIVARRRKRIVTNRSCQVKLRCALARARHCALGYAAPAFVSVHPLGLLTFQRLLRLAEREPCLLRVEYEIKNAGGHDCTDLVRDGIARDNTSCDPAADKGAKCHRRVDVARTPVRWRRPSPAGRGRTLAISP